MHDLPQRMHAVAIDRFGGPEVLEVKSLPVPTPGPRDVLIRVAFAGIAEWDVYEQEGGFASMLRGKPTFPYVLGSEGAGVVEDVGGEVERFSPGDRVYAMRLPQGGFYAEYTTVPEDDVALVPGTLLMEQAAGLGWIGVTALRGLEDVLDVKPGESVLVLGASGGVGHAALQLAKLMGARVLAVASGADGVELARRLGADAAVDGREGDVVAAAREFAPDGLDAALLTAGGDVAQRVLSTLREGGRAAYPHGVDPEPQAVEGIRLQAYDADPGRDAMERLNRLVERGPFQVHIADIFPLEEIARAEEAVGRHHLGKVVLRIG
ncbi:MAG TPA: NADP-dependent oxidoreductase [Longimicrobiales bacterium]